MPMSRPGAFGDKEEDLDVYSPISAHARQKSRSTADTCPSKAIPPNLIESRVRARAQTVIKTFCL